jgi:nucleoside-diphosphate-sugar epimerase
MKHAFVTGGSGFVGRALIKNLVARGVTVTALARSAAAAKTVASFRATPWHGDLDDVAKLTKGMQGCDTVFHVAGYLTEWASYQAFHDANVVGTANAVHAARAAGVTTFVAAGASAVVMGRPASMLGITEDLPLQYPGWGPYITTKAKAEQAVRGANRAGFKTVVVRPPLIWGAGMPLLADMVAAVKSGQFALPDGGRHAMSIGHVDNVAECLVLAAEHGRGGEAYFVSDGVDSTLGDVLADLLQTQGVPPVKRAVPFALAWRMAAIMEGVWRLCRIKSKPPVTRQTLRMIGQDFTLDISKARRDLGYAPVTSRAQGLAAMRAIGHLSAEERR